MDYRLPAAVRERLHAALTGRRNKDACLTLATFIARFWSSPRKLGLPFMLDRRALAPIEALGLTEARVRGAIRALERVGFLDRAVTGGRTHQATPEGLHRRPVAFTFGADYRDAFSMANKRAAATRDRRSRMGRAQIPAKPQRASTTSPTNSPKYKPSEATKVYLGEQRVSAPAQAELNPKLEAALDRWQQVFEKQVFKGKMSSANSKRV